MLNNILKKFCSLDLAVNVEAVSVTYRFEAHHRQKRLQALRIHLSLKSFVFVA